MKVLVLYCDTGGGHHSAALAMAEELQARNHEVTLLDPYQLVSNHIAKIVGDTYIKLVQHSPKSFGTIYTLGEAYEKLPFHSPVYWANGKMTKILENYLLQNQFDRVVMTHTFPAQMMAHIPHSAFSHLKTMLIATDYTCTPFFEETDCDYYGIPSLDLTEDFIKRGIPQKKIFAYGIPVRKVFTSVDEKSNAYKNQDACHQILLTGGSMGAGQLEKAAQILESYLKRHFNYRLIIICGNNEKLYTFLYNKYAQNKRIDVLGFTVEMPSFLKSSDIFITKPGGLSSTEAAVCETPMIHLPGIPGCETMNAQYFSSHGMSLSISHLSIDLIPALEALEDRQVRQAMKKAQKQTIFKNAAKRYCELLEL